MQVSLKRVLSSVAKLPFPPAEKKQVRNIFLTGAVEAGVLSDDDAKRLRK